jgi:hypothetical protein
MPAFALPRPTIAGSAWQALGTSPCDRQHRGRSEDESDRGVPDSRASGAAASGRISGVAPLTPPRLARRTGVTAWREIPR